jgi:DNA anti-recombination protein RmuC
MGSSISSVIEQQQEAMKAQAQDQLQALLTMATVKQNIFLKTLKDSTDNTLIPVDKILEQGHSVQAGVSSDASNLKNAITGAINDFAKGDILDGKSSVFPLLFCTPSTAVDRDHRCHRHGA